MLALMLSASSSVCANRKRRECWHTVRHHLISRIKVDSVDLDRRIVAMEVIPQPAESAELVVGDQGMSSDALWVVLLANLFILLFKNLQETSDCHDCTTTSKQMNLIQTKHTPATLLQQRLPYQLPNLPPGRPRGHDVWSA